MKKTFRLLVSSVLLGLLAAGPLPLLHSAIADIDAKQGSGVYNNVDMYRLTQAGIIYLSTSSVSAGITLDPSTGITLEAGKDITLPVTSDLVLGSLTTAVSTTTTSGTSQGTIFTAYLKDGGATVGTIAAVEGSVLCSTTASTNAGDYVTVVVCPATLDFTGWVGIAAAAASTGSVVNVYDSGWVLARTTGTVVAGDVLVTTGSVAGYLWRDTTPTTGADVGVAMGPGNAAGGLTRIRLR
jgi:hypothetical protein